MSEEKIGLSTIRRDGGTQARAAMNEDYVQELRTVLKKGGELPEVVVFFDGKDRWLGDGFHTVAAYEAEEKTYTTAKIRKGTQRDAILYAVGANETHGLRRTPADKRHAVAMLLADEEWSKSSDNWISEQCRVSNHLVADVRKSKVGEIQPARKNEAGSESGTSPDSEKRTGKDGKQYPATQTRAERVGQVKPQSVTEAPKRHREPGDEKPADVDSHGRKKKKPRKPPAARDELKDKAGNVLPDSCRDVFADATLTDLVAEVELVEGMLAADAWVKKAGKLTAHYGFILFEKFSEHCLEALHQLQVALADLQAGVPYGVCPKCGGIDSKKDGKICRGCRGYSAVPEHRYKELKA